MKLKSWDKLPREEQDLYLTLLWQDNHTEQAIADFLQATKGQIVRRRQTGLKLPTGKREKVKSKVEPERFFDLVDLHKMREMEERGVAAMAPVEKSGEATVQKAPLKEKPVLRLVPGEKEKLETPSQEAPVIVSVVEKKGLGPLCEWPTSTGKALKKPTICGEPVVPGKRVCKTHDALIRGLSDKR